ncbi:MAG: Uma2 family endonuclease [Gemmatimonadaceae bacterium]|jgi:Uma2 family endonuclease|nr:Uma2 family endonuclease [Gemmatimonadaceae bacterium]
MAMVLTPAAGPRAPTPSPGVVWTRAHRDAIPDERSRWEIIDGVLCMTPAPATPHQRIVLQLSVLLHAAIEARALPLDVMPAPVDVWGSDEDVVQPDLLVCRRDDAADPGHVDVGRVLLAIEITSPRSRARDLRRKSDWYRRHGVPAYWVIDLEDGSATERTETGRRRAVPTLVWRPAPGAEPVTVDVAVLLERARIRPSATR